MPGSAPDASRFVRLRSLLTLLEPLSQYIQEVNRVAGLEAVEINDKLSMIREAGEMLARETMIRYGTIHDQLEEYRRELNLLLTPPRPDMGQTMQLLLQELETLTKIVQKVALRDELLKRWQTASAFEILQDYEAALEAGETAKVELYEAYAEMPLMNKGDATCLNLFRQRKQKAMDARLTPAQRAVKQELSDLDELESFLVLVRLAAEACLRLNRGDVTG